MRPASADDAESIVSILRNANDWLQIQQSKQWIPGAHDDDVHLVDQMIAHGGCYVAVRDEKIIGTVRLATTFPTYWTNYQPENSYYLSTLYVHRDVAGHGIGAAVLQWAEQLARTDSDYVCLDCYAPNIKLCAYYASQGYQQIGFVDSYVDYPAQLYQKYVR